MGNLLRIKTLKELIHFSREQFADKTALMFRRKKEEIHVTYTELSRDIDSFGTYIYKCGIKNQNIAILGENSYEWIVSFCAIANGNNVSVPLDKEKDAQTIHEMLVSSDCNVVFYSRKLKNKVIELRRIEEKEQMERQYFCLSHFEQMKKEGGAYLEQGYDEFIKENISPDKRAAIYFTSGTTGAMKGVCLSHRNFASNVYNGAIRLQPRKICFLVLPLSHTFSIVASLFCVLIGGKTVYICGGLKSFFRDLNEVKPDTIVVVPLFVNTIYKTIWKEIHEQGREKQVKLLGKVSNALLKVKIDIRRVFFKKIVNSLGGNLETIVCGGAMLNEEMIQSFKTWGISIYNGYGITECSPIISVNYYDAYQEGSVGIPLGDVNVDIQNPNELGIGEICVSGPNVMEGYYQNEEQTREVMVEDWYHTGDLGYIDSDGYLFITGRLKNLIILSNGENVSPELIEQKLETLALIKEVMVYSENDKIVAEIFPDEEFAERHQIKDIQRSIEEFIEEINRTYPNYQRIQKIVLRENEFVKNTNKKIIRNAVV